MTLFDDFDDSPAILPTSPKDFEFKILSAKEACAYNEIWHSRLPIIHWSNVVRNTHSICFGAFFRGNVFAVTIWSSPVAQNRFKYGKQVLELRRMAISPNCPKNTATRMLAHDRKWIKDNLLDIALLVSYQDTEVHLGTIYKADNWVAADYTKGMNWNTDVRVRNVEQSLADKVRWEYKLHDFVEVIDKPNELAEVI